MRTWIVVVNRSGAKIFGFNNRRDSDVEFLTQLENPRGRLRARDINADKPGHFAAIHSYGSNLTQPQSPTARVAQEFAKRLALYLDEAYQHHAFEELVLIAEPQFLGRLRAVLSKDLRRAITHEIAKDLGPITRQELKRRLWAEPEDLFF